MAEKANHHYVPQYYLRNFAIGKGRKARVFVADLDQKKTFGTLVRNVGSKRYFFRIDAKTHDPNYVEDEIGKIEAELSVHLSEVIDARSFPSHDHRNSLMNIIAMMAVRNPRLRASITESQQGLARRVADTTVQSEETWQAIKRQMARDGYHVDASVSYEDLRDYVERGDYDVEIDKTYLIQTELSLIEPVLRTCSMRKWRFISAPEGSYFVTSDDPVVLTFTNGNDGPYPPGFGLKNTLVYFSLCSDLAIVGTFENPEPDGFFDAAQVASANSLCAAFANQQLYAMNDRFQLWGPDGSLLSVKEFLNLTK